MSHMHESCHICQSRVAYECHSEGRCLLRCVAVCCGVLRCVAVCVAVYVAVCCRQEVGLVRFAEILYLISLQQK